MTCTGVSRAGEVATGIREGVTGKGAGGSGADTGSGSELVLALELSLE